MGVVGKETWGVVTVRVGGVEGEEGEGEPREEARAADKDQYADDPEPQREERWVHGRNQ